MHGETGFIICSSWSERGLSAEAAGWASIGCNEVVAEIEVSIIIPTKNGGATFAKTLVMVYSQSYPRPFEVVIIDSGSIDDTLDIARRYPARLVQIRPEDFGHGRTRNLGARLAVGRWLVFITQDAIPTSDRWLHNLVRHLEAPDVAGVYGRQIPREDTNPVERFFLHSRYPAHRIVQSARQGQVNMDTIFFSNVNSAVKREVFDQHPFMDDLIMSEDQEWGKWVLLNGYDIIYEPEAAVYHSHNFGPREVFKRYFDSGVSLAQFAHEEYSSKKFIRNGLNYVRQEMKFLVDNGCLQWIPYALLYDLSKFMGLSLGKRERFLAAALKRRLSLHASYWATTERQET